MTSDVTQLYRLTYFFSILCHGDLRDDGKVTQFILTSYPGNLRDDKIDVVTSCYVTSCFGTEICVTMEKFSVK